MTKKETPALSRRGLLAGAGTVGVAAVAVGTLGRVAAPEVVAAAAEPLAPAQGGGYQLTPHVLRYYQTAKV